MTDVALIAALDKCSRADLHTLVADLFARDARSPTEKLEQVESVRRASGYKRKWDVASRLPAHCSVCAATYPSRNAGKHFRSAYHLRRVAASGEYCQMLCSAPREAHKRGYAPPARTAGAERAYQPALAVHAGGNVLACRLCGGIICTDATLGVQ